MSYNIYEVVKLNLKNYKYTISYNNILIDGAFFFEEEYGFYFFTTHSKEELELDSVSIRIDNNIIYLCPNGNISVKKIARNDKYMYAFIFPFNEKYPDVYALSLDDLNMDDNISLFTGGEILECLGSIFKLPNGNYVCSSVQSYITAIEEITNNYGNKEHFFRGHYFYKYKLIPSLYRKKKYYDNESFMYMDFKTQFYNELSNKKYIEILTTMQHYKMPTRLLDTTSNPLVALYMACDKPVNYKSNNYGVGEVIIMNEDIKNIKYSDSNAVTLLSCLSVLETNYKQELYEKIIESIEKKDDSIYKNSLAYKRFVAEVHNELSFFDESFFTPEVLLKPRHVKVGMINERIIAQSGSFILFGLCNYLTGEYMALDTVTKQRVFIVNRNAIMKQLELLNINPGTMYPDKDHMSVSITKSYE